LLLGLVQNVTNLGLLNLSDDLSARGSEAAQLLECFLRETIDVLRAVLGVASIEDNVVTSHCKVLYSQIVCKFAWLLLQFGKVLSKLDPATKSHFILMMLPSMVNITQLGSNALQLMTNMVGDSSMGYYYSRVLYWHAGINLIQLLQCIAFNLVSMSPNNNVDPNVVASAALPLHQLQQQVHIWSLQKRVFSYLQSTVPTTQDIFYEMHRSEDYTQNLFSSQEDTSLMQLLEELGVSRSTGGPINSSPLKITHGGTALDAISFKLRFLLIGMNSIFRGYSIMLSRSTCNYRDPVPPDALRLGSGYVIEFPTDLSTYTYLSTYLSAYLPYLPTCLLGQSRTNSLPCTSVPFPAKDKWVLSLTEIVLNILGRVRQCDNTGPSPTALHLLRLCPYLAQHLLTLTAHNSPLIGSSKEPPHSSGQTPSHLIYIDLAKAS